MEFQLEENVKEIKNTFYFFMIWPIFIQVRPTEMRVLYYKGVPAQTTAAKSVMKAFHN